MPAPKTKAKAVAVETLRKLNISPSDVITMLEGLGRDNDGYIMVSDPGFKREGTQIILPATPAPMSIQEGIGVLFRYLEDEETEMDVIEEIAAFPQDAAVAFNQALKEIYGWASSVPTPGFWGPEPPQMITVQTGPGKHDFVQVPWGSFAVPGIDNRIEIKGNVTAEGATTLLIGSVKKRERSVLVELAQKTRDILETSSIYKGKAIMLKPDKDGKLDLNNAPTFFDPGKNQELILNAGEEGHLKSSLWAPIIHTARCVAEKIPLKRGVLLEGPFGIGKTLTGRKTAQICIENGWTYILLEDVRALKTALTFAKRYQPAVVFAEDIDRIIATRDQAGNDLLNVIDGVLSKDAQVITVLTTNHVEIINKAMLRPGRLDAVISVRPPEAPAVKRLLRLYGRDRLDAKETLDKIADKLAGQIPATIREVMERSKLSMIFNGNEKVSEDDLINAAVGMQQHMDLLRDQPRQKTPHERLGEAITEVVGNTNNTLENAVKVINSNLEKFGPTLRVKADPLPTAA